jgi:hypothetical protein
MTIKEIKCLITSTVAGTDATIKRMKKDRERKKKKGVKENERNERATHGKAGTRKRKLSLPCKRAIRSTSGI